MMQRYTKKELRILLCCFAVYTAAYISRTNLSPSLGAIAESFHLSGAAVGLLPTMFSLPYAVFQVVIGTFADRITPRRFLFTGILGSALVNMFFSFSPAFEWLVVLWFINGIFQAMIWTPIVRIFSTQLRDSVRDHAMFFISLTLIAGYLCAWSLSGFLTSLVNWRVAFLVSGLTTMIIGVISVFEMHDVSDHAPAQTKKTTDSVQSNRTPVSHLFLHTNLIFLLITCLCNGYVRDSIMNWAAKLMMDTQGLDLNSTVGIVLIIPAVNFIGIQLGRTVYYRTSSNVYKASFILFAASLLFSMILSVTFRLGPVVCIILLALISAMAYGLNPLLTSLMPLKFIHADRIALTAGLMDAMIYAGSALSGTFAGHLSDQYGWSAVFISWILFCAVGCICTLIASSLKNKGGISP